MSKEIPEARIIRIDQYEIATPCCGKMVMFYKADYESIWGC